MNGHDYHPGSKADVADQMALRVVKRSVPQEGAPRWVDSLAIPANAAHKSSADRFVDFYLKPEIAAQVAEFIQADTGTRRLCTGCRSPCAAIRSSFRRKTR
jgi:hypothetical protein